MSVGWSPAWRAHVAVESAMSGMPLSLARVVNVHKSHVDVVSVTDDGEPRADLRLKVDGALMSAYGEDYPPAVGDWLMLDDERVHALVPRRTLITRPSAGRDSKEQLIAANVDIALVIEPFVPTFSLGRVERLAALAESAGVEPWIVCTKTDLVDDEEISRFRGPLEAKFPPRPVRLRAGRGDGRRPGGRDPSRRNDVRAGALRRRKDDSDQPLDGCIERGGRGARN